MYSLTRIVTNHRGGKQWQGVPRLTLTASLLLLLTLLLAACSSATATSTPVPAPTDTPVSEVMVTPSVAVGDQEIVDGKVTIAQAISDGPGWLVIHADKDGKPGPVLGQTAVQDGENADVVVELAEEGRTEILYAMLHTDGGTLGTYEFPGDDVPVNVDGKVVTPAFHIIGGTSALTPSVTVEDQEVVDSKVTIARVISDGPGWLVIHAQQDGKPGPILGYSAVAEGDNTDVVVALDLSGATETLYAMLHADAGQVGTYEFPGDDVPVKRGEAIVMSPFSLQVVEGNAVNVSMIDFSFTPTELVIRAGTTVTWINNDGSVSHTATSDTGLWDSGLFSGGDTFSFAFDQPGVYPYYCQPHGGPGGRGMAGTIIVVP